MAHKPVVHVYRFFIISVTKRLKMILGSSREERHMPWIYLARNRQVCNRAERPGPSSLQDAIKTNLLTLMKMNLKGNLFNAKDKSNDR
jgi:hypothetical protein